MTTKWLNLSAALAVLALNGIATAATPAELANDAYTLRLDPSGSVLLTARDASAPAASAAFRPAFSVLFTKADPKIALRPSGESVSYNVPTWHTGKKPTTTAPAATADQLGKVDTRVVAGDGFDPSILEGDAEGRTPDLFRSAPAVTVTATSGNLADNHVTWTFADHPSFTLAATVDLPPGRAEPRLTVRLTPKSPGFYSVGYTGAPDLDLKDVAELWQPLIWTEKRIPARSYLTPAFQGPLPAAMVSAAGVTTTVIADPDELPFQPLPTFANSTFGMAVRNAAGRAQPMLFAPILGGPGSEMAAGKPFTFRARLAVHRGSCTDAFDRLARDLYDFRDHRRNATCSLNTALENMISYGLSEYSRFNEDLRGCSYDTDAPGTVKNVSALHPLSLALVTDDESIYRRRARPLIEFLLSREKFLFATDPDIQIQSPGWRLTGPCAPVAELSSLYQFSQRRTPLFLDYAREQAGKKSESLAWQNYLSLYRSTRDPADLAKARSLADAYLAHRVDKPATDYDSSAFFWTSFAPAWIDLIELFEETGDPRYLAAAGRGAKLFSQYIWFCPRIPDAPVTVNKGNVAPEYWYLKKRGVGPIRIPEETVPAWRLSEIGLTCESSGTASGHRAIMLANQSPWMLRLAHHLRDPFLHDVARSGVVGRYANFPGYHINTERTTVYEKPDYPLRPFNQLTYNSFHFNHIWPHMAMVVDYLVSDTFYRSAGAIDFPSHYAEGYAYLKSKVYGDRPGRFYDAADACLWMPRGLVASDNVQLNYVAARNSARDTLFLAFANQSPEQQTATITLNPELVGLSASHPVRVWVDNKPSAPLTLADDRLTITVPAAGLTALAVQGVRIQPRFQDKLLAGGSPLSPGSHTTLPVGSTKAMLLSFGQDLTSAYVYLQDTFKETKQATLRYRTSPAADWQTVTDAAYPYEFTVELSALDQQFEFSIETLGTDGQPRRSDNATLRR